MLNEVRLIGNLGRDPELRSSRSGNPVCNLSVATSRKWFDKIANEEKEETEWHRVVVFGKQAEACANYLAKGRKVFVAGRLKTSSYEKEGQKHYATDIIAERVQFLDKAQGSAGSGGADYSAAPIPADVDDIPF